MSCRAWPSGLLDLHGRGRDGRGRVVEVDRRDDGAQALGVEDADVLLVDLDEAVMGEAREHAAYGLELEAEVGADFGARHAQHELAAGVAAVFEALGERQEEGGKTLLGTSHRQTPVKSLVASIREGLGSFFSLPDGYEIALGNGGASAFWDIACASLIAGKAAFGTYGSFSTKFAKSAQSAPFLDDPVIFAGEPGTYRLPERTDGVDTYAWAHNETSTGVSAPVRRVEGSDEQNAIVVVDGTSAAGALPVDVSQTDAYYFSPQKAFGSDGGLWIAVLSPAAIDRAYGIAKSVSLPGARRWIPPFLSLTSAIENSRKDQTLNTPAVATLVMLENQVRWLNDNGGLAWATARCARSASLLYQWAERSDYAQPFVSDENARSNAVVTIDLDESINASQVVAALRENGIMDTNGYRKLGRNQLRIGVFPSVEPSDVEALTKCVDYVAEHL